MKKKIFFSIFIFALSFSFASFVKINLVGAAISKGWVWGGSEDATIPGKAMGVVDGNETGVGWISFSGTTAGSGGGSYGVNIPVSDGPVNGYAWSSNLKSYIDFAPRAGCPTEKYAGSCNDYPASGATKSDVMRSGSSLVGFARIVGISKELAAGNSGGEDGWISLDPGNGLGVTIGSDGKISGKGWAGSALGALSFESIEGPLPTAVTIQVSPNIFNLTSGQVFVANSNVVRLDWTVVGTEIQSCATSCTDQSGSAVACPGWQGINPRSSNTVSNIPLAAYIENFTITCTDNDGKVTTASALVQTGCTIGGCSSTEEVCKPFTGPFTPTNNGDAAVCQGGCKTDNDCVFRQGDNWREVAP